MTVVVGMLVGAGYFVLDRMSGPVVGSGCRVALDGAEIELSVEQAANAATIAGVAFERGLPKKAVVIAFATVFQESDFMNLPGGDRDSVGLFQQRPSMGWGEVEQLLDPVFAAGAFYDGLVEVPGYQDLPVHEAAQAVQRSADGFAYDQHEDEARILAAAFTGEVPGAVYCWYPDAEARPPAVEAADEELRRVYGVSADASDGGAPTGDRGWSMAAWAVAHAQHFGLGSVTQDDRVWTAEQGAEGWTTVEEAAPALRFDAAG
ncbi:hypothetical protein [Allonocardiopsis opalescens]|uniref:hypothetical protein n=1 Tax=Allonocardiopsis opalescens TaxID=1144618 RepID=UPI001FEBF803|nr:hypothetical protein [Allonocardiopsis opalescens]